MPIETVTTGLFEGYTLAELKEQALVKLKQTPGNYNRYSEASIEMALNDGQVEAVRYTRCLRSFAIIILKDGYSQYKPPSQYLLPDAAYFYQSSDSYTKLQQKTRSWLDQFKPGWRVTDGNPSVMYPGDNYGNLRKLGFYPTPNTDGYDYVVNPDTGIYASSDGITTSGNVTGTNNAASATVCTDTDGRTLSDLGIQVGMTAVNTVDESSGQITDVTGSTFTVILAGGTTNAWGIGETFMVLAGEYGVVVDWENNEQYLFSSEIGGMIDVTLLTGNVLLNFIKRPIRLQIETQRPEIPPELHQYLPDYVPYSLKRNSPRGSTDEKEAAVALQAFKDGILNGYIDLEQVQKDDSVLRFHQ